MSIFDDKSLPGPFDSLFGGDRDGLLNPSKFEIDVRGNVVANGAFTGCRIDPSGTLEGGGCRTILDQFGNSTGFRAGWHGIGRGGLHIDPLNSGEFDLG